MASGRIATPRIALLVALLSAFGSTALSAQSVEPIFADDDPGDWEFLELSGDPAIDLSRSAGGDPHLVVGHRHFASGYSFKRSFQGGADAVYDPAVRGAAGAMEIAARIRVRFTGQPPAYYSSRVVQVRPVIRQSGALYHASTDLHVWITQLPTGVWVPAVLSNLTADRFSIRGEPGGPRPDFSATGAPMTVGLIVTTSFQAGDTVAREHSFEVDIDEFRLAMLRPGTGLPRMSVSRQNGSVLTRRGLAGLFSIPSANRAGQVIPFQVELSAPSPVAVAFALDGEGGQIFPAGEVSHQFTRFSRGPYSAEVTQLSNASPAELVEPKLAAWVLNVIFEDGFCSYEAAMEWQEDMADLGYELAYDDEVPSNRATRSQAPPTFLSRLSAATSLATVRAFRDQVMIESAAGRRYAALYETFSPALIRAMLRRPMLMVDVLRADGPWVAALGELVAGRGDEALVTAQMTSDLLALLDGFADAGEPALARAIAEERARLGLDQVGGLTIGRFWDRVVERGEAAACAPGATTLCLNGGRYRVEADFTPFGEPTQRARAVPLSADSGYFWFFDAANVELLAKVLEGCGANGRIWSYNAGLTNLAVDLFVVDEATGRGKIYRNEAGEGFAPILDSDFLDCAGNASAAAPPQGPSAVRAATIAAPSELGGVGCTADATTLCLLDDRFRVTARWTTATGASGAAQAAPLTADTGTFWFFDAGNIELVVKAIDACGLAGFENFWLFAAGTTDVAVELRVLDTIGGEEKVYRRPLGAPFAPVLDSAAFATCAP